jgi:hypothetical protein
VDSSLSLKEQGFASEQRRSLISPSRVCVGIAVPTGVPRQSDSPATDSDFEESIPHTVKIEAFEPKPQAFLILDVVTTNACLRS